MGGLFVENESLLQALPTIQLPSTEKIYRFIKDNSLPGKGIGRSVSPTCRTFAAFVQEGELGDLPPRHLPPKGV